MSIEDIFAKLKKDKSPNRAKEVEWIIAGLGNPGNEYASSRHNAGFICIDRLAEKNNFSVKKIKFKSLIADEIIENKRCIVMKPSTFMNNSGEAIGECAAFYKIPPERILIIYDDISLDIGKLRIRRKGSDGGHNGIKSIIYHLGSNNFPRIKIGVGAKPSPDYDLAKWVLSSFPKEDRENLLTATDNAIDSLYLIINDKTDEAMNKHNS